MEALDLARWQFGITTVYHFIFVPLTIGLTPLVALMQTFWVSTGKEHWLKLTKFFGKLMLINFAIGIATGIVQEFQFGMNWSEYSRFVGDIFGAPLAMEALLAFFIESTFLGLWIFGWDKLPKKVHLAAIWLVAFASNLSAYFILIANSWMQHPTGAELVTDPETGRTRAQMIDLGAVLFNPTALASLSHVITISLLTAGTFVTGIAAWWLVRAVKAGNVDLATQVWRPAVVFGTVVMLVGGIGSILTGDWQAKMMFEQQPMKMAAAEAMTESFEDGAPFSILSFGNLNGDPGSVTTVLSVPGVTSFLASGDFNSPLMGTDDLQDRYSELFGEGVNYVPYLPVTYWSFRLMIGLGTFSALLALASLWLVRGGRVTDKSWFAKLALIAIPMPYIASMFGWIFTEMGRQPWIVAPNVQGLGDMAAMPTANGLDYVWQLTQNAVSTSVGAPVVIISMVVYTLVYAVCAVLWFTLMKRYATKGVNDVEPDVSPEANKDSDENRPMSFAY